MKTRKPTPKQIDYLRVLYERAGLPFGRPPSYEEAQSMISLLKRQIEHKQQEARYNARLTARDMRCIAA